MKQLKVSLPDELRARLDKAAAEAGHSVAEDIRQRLERTLADDAIKGAIDPKTRELTDDIVSLIDRIELDTGSSWHRKTKVHETLALAVQALLATLRPRPETGVGASDLLFDFDPQTLSHAIVRQHLRFKEELRKSEQELREIHKREKP
jgi:hypothetical protein